MASMPASMNFTTRTINRADQVQDLRGDPERRRRMGDDIRALRRRLPQGQPTASSDSRSPLWPSPSQRRTEDENFLGGGDVITYLIPVGSGSGPYTVTAELLFQSIGFRWADNLRQAGGPEIDQFLSFYAAVPNTPVVIANASLESP
jgi:hypothetical protein